MLKHRYIAGLFIFLLAILILLNQWYTIHLSIYLLLSFLFFSIEFYGSAFIHSNFHVNTFCKIETSDKVVALTFDDGPVLQTEKVLDVLNHLNVQATFFCIGHRIKDNEDILRNIDLAGHLIGNHSYSHGNLFDLKTTAALIKDLQEANDEIKNVIHKSPIFFRPPYGVTTPGISRAVKKLNYLVIGWNIRSFDTSIKDKNKVLSRIKERLVPGSVILLHDRIEGIEMLVKELIIYLHEQNYKIVGLDELLQKKPYA